MYSIKEKRIDYIAIKKFKRKLTALRALLEYENKIQEIKGLNFEMEEQVKDELNELETKKDEELKELKERLNCERVWKKLCGSDFNINDEIILRQKHQKGLAK